MRCYGLLKVTFTADDYSPLPTSTPIPLSGGSLITNALCIDYEDSKTVDSKFYSQPPYERGIKYMYIIMMVISSIDMLSKQYLKNQLHYWY